MDIVKELRYSAAKIHLGTKMPPPARYQKRISMVFHPASPFTFLLNGVRNLSVMKSSRLLPFGKSPTLKSRQLTTRLAHRGKGS